jgi:hypothetical protein
MYRVQKGESDDPILREMLELLQTQPIVSLRSISEIGGEFGERFIQDLAALYGDPKSLMAMRPMSLFDLIWASKWIDPNDLQALEEYWEHSFTTIDKTQSVEHQLRLFLAKRFIDKYPNQGKPLPESGLPYPDRIDLPLYAISRVVSPITAFQFDPRLPRKLLEEQFNEMLTVVRRDLSLADKQVDKQYNRVSAEKYAEQRILPYWDIQRWMTLQQSTIPHPALACMLWPNQEGGINQLKTTMKTVNAMKDKTSLTWQTLQTVAAAKAWSTHQHL